MNACDHAIVRFAFSKSATLEETYFNSQGWIICVRNY